MTAAGWPLPYANGGYRVTLHGDGTKVREEIDPSLPPELPEQLDLKVTDWCDAGCAWCHEGSTTRGRHGDLEAVLPALSELPRGGEVAAGGGDPLAHPGFPDFARRLSGIGLVVAVTVNGRHVERHLPLLRRLTGEGWVRGVGISWAGSFPDWDWPHVVHHVIAGVDHPSLLDGREGLRLLVLGYKDWGRGKALLGRREEEIRANERAWFRMLPVLARRHRLSFDTLAVERLKPRRLFRDPGEFDRRFMGDEGKFSLYIDAVEGRYGVSSFTPRLGPVGGMREMFASVRGASSGVGR